MSSFLVRAESSATMSGRQVFDLILKGFKKEHGLVVKPSPKKADQCVSLLQTMLDNGWNPKKLTPGLLQTYTECKNDLEVLISGEDADQSVITKRYKGGRLNSLLTGIIDPDGMGFGPPI